jgi:large conductance mechanosensitive channel
VAAAKAAGATTLNYGIFVNNIVSFLIIAFCAFLIVRMVNKLIHPHGTPDVPKTKSCPYCAMDIPITATRCPNCTSQLAGASAA